MMKEEGSRIGQSQLQKGEAREKGEAEAKLADAKMGKQESEEEKKQLQKGETRKRRSRGHEQTLKEGGSRAESVKVKTAAEMRSIGKRRSRGRIDRC